MNKKELNDLLDTIYELEGLVHLAISRDDEETHLLSLIKRKASELTDRIESEGVENPVDQHLSIEKMEKSLHEVSDNEEIDECVANADTVVEESIDESLTEPVFNNAGNAKIATLGEMTDRDDGCSDNHMLDHKNVTPRGKLVFSLNDRYRFKRELFSNSTDEFNKAMAEIASMDSFEEAEGYFIDELGWEPDNDDVIAFLNVLQNYFK